MKEVSISSEELQLILRIIDVVSKRGGFLPCEFVSIGSFWQKYSKILEESSNENESES